MDSNFDVDLLTAAKDGDLKSFTNNLDYVSNSGVIDRALIKAVKGEVREEIVRAIPLKNLKEETIEEALGILASKGRLDLIQFLTPSGTTDSQTNSMAASAAEAGDLRIIELVLGSASCADSTMSLALNRAAIAGKRNVCEMILKKKLLSIAAVSNAIYSASLNGHRDVIDFFQSQYPETNFASSIFIGASTSCDPGLIRDTIKHHEEVSPHYAFAIERASISGNVEIVELILRASSTISISGAICAAIQHSRGDVLAVLLKEQRFQQIPPADLIWLWTVSIDCGNLEVFELLNRRIPSETSFSIRRIEGILEREEIYEILHLESRFPNPAAALRDAIYSNRPLLTRKLFEWNLVEKAETSDITLASVCFSVEDFEWILSRFPEENPPALAICTLANRGFRDYLSRFPKNILLEAMQCRELSAIGKRHLKKLVD